MHRTHMYSIRVNGTYIGTVVESAAHILAEQLCRKVGDAAVVTEQECEEEYDRYSNLYNYTAPDRREHTYYRNTSGLMCFTGLIESSWVRHEISSPTPTHINHRLHTHGYSAAVSGFKYNREDARHSHGTSVSLPFMKRQINRISRRVGKSLIQEELSDTCTECFFE